MSVSENDPNSKKEPSLTAAQAQKTLEDNPGKYGSEWNYFAIIRVMDKAGPLCLSAATREELLNIAASLRLDEVYQRGNPPVRVI